ncbi:MAG: sugar phosphate nucleotidyltransferase [Candidatus Thorarchaeota archaeon]
MRAIILAGGKGTRLRPYTYSLPKPLMPIGGEIPILGIILKQLKNHSFDEVTITVNYMARIIQSFFEDGKDWGLKIDYSLEKKMLGTVGPLTLIKNLPKTFLVMNGDLLTDLDFKKFFEWHIKNDNDISVATFKRMSQNDSGVLYFDDERNIYDFKEKPIEYHNISMGIYVLNKSIIEDLPKNEKIGFDQLILDAIKNKLKIKAYPHTSYWLDIGCNSDYEKANDYFIQNRSQFLDL